MAFSLAHISDVHLGPLPDVRVRDLLSKRATGYANWKRNRAKHMGSDALTGLVNSLQAAQPDHTVVTGDLMNIALDAEIENTGAWLEALGHADDVSIVPGNHDAYVRGILQKALQRWAPYVTGDDGRTMRENSDFPYVRVRGPVALIGLNSAIATAPFVAAGRINADQCARLAAILDETKKQGLFRVVLIHHPPVHGAAKPQKRLFGIGRIQRVLKKNGVELVLHGHTHLPQRHQLKCDNGATAHIIGVPSASEGIGAKRPASTFNMFEISGSASANWQCKLTPHMLTTLTGLHAPGPIESLIF